MVFVSIVIVVMGATGWLVLKLIARWDASNTPSKIQSDRIKGIFALAFVVSFLLIVGYVKMTGAWSDYNVAAEVERE